MERIGENSPWPRFGITPILRCRNLNRFGVNALARSAWRSLVWHDVCHVSGTS
jgi:hypothetical protein